jgi:hypothetical protein
MFGADLRSEWILGTSFGSNTYALTAATPAGGGPVDMSDGQTLTCAIVMLGITDGVDSITFGLQESSSSIAGPWTGITDANASITLSQVAGASTIGVITGQRTLQYARVAANSNGTDTVGITAVILDIRTQMPLGASGASRSPAGPSTVT